MTFKKIIYFLIIIIGFAMTSLSLAIFVLPSWKEINNSQAEPKVKGAEKITLEFWGLWDNTDDWREVIDRYQEKKHYFEGKEVEVKINYFKKTPATYEYDLKEAFEKNRAPDIFMVHQNWLPRYLDHLEPLPNDNISQENYQLVSYENLVEDYPSQLINDVIYSGGSGSRLAVTENNQIYALPFYSDSLALFYNKDIFEKAEIEAPPATWKEFKEVIKKLTRLDRKGNFIQAGAAIGNGKNVNRSGDLLALLMMQGGAEVIGRNSEVDINKEIIIKTSEGLAKREAGKMAIKFYTDFADPDGEFYTWNGEQKNSIDAFADGEAAMMFNYQYQTKNLLVKNPELNYGIAPMVQIENSVPINFSNYWLSAVKISRELNSGYPELSSLDTGKIAWNFLSFASQPENVKLYLESAGKAAARKDLIAEQAKLNNYASVFAAQAVSARSFYRPDDQIDFILTEMIDEINNNREDWEEVVDKGVEEIEGVLK